MAIDKTLVDLVREYEAMDSVERGSDKGQAIRKNIHLIGYTADFVGGYEGMQKLHDAADSQAGNDSRVGYWLNKLWDGIGDWQS